MKIPNCTIGCKVTGKRVNRGAGYALVIPICTDLLVPKKQAEKNLKNVFQNIIKKVNKCVKKNTVNEKKH